MRLALYLVAMGVFFGGLGAFGRLFTRRDEPDVPGIRELTISLDVFSPLFYYGGLAALAAGLLLGLAQLVAGALG